MSATARASVSRHLGLSRRERSVLERCSTTRALQAYIDSIPINEERNGDTCYTVREVLRHRCAHCIEAALVAACALWLGGEAPLLLDLRARRDFDHVVALFRRNGLWGAISKSNHVQLRGRDPVYRSLRELAMSYFNIYFNLRCERTLRRYSRPVNLTRFDHLNWMTTDKPIWFIAEHLCEIPHISLLTPTMEKNLTRVDRRTRRGEMVGHRKK